MILEYTIPESKKDISLKRYLKVIKIYKDADKRGEEPSESEVVSACLGIRKDLVSKIPFDEYREIIEGITKTLASESILHLTFKLNGVKYGFINDLENMTAGEYAHLDQFLKDADNNAFRIINVLYRPIKKEKVYKRIFSNKKDKKYLIEPYDQDRDVSIFENAPYEIYESALVFFYNLSKQLVNATQKFMKEEEVQTMIKQLGSQQNGDGIRHLTHTLQQSVLDLKKLEIYQSIRYSCD